jgi:protein-S-isoprenylcysteine O-methyltransferase Ste14
MVRWLVLLSLPLYLLAFGLLQACLVARYRYYPEKYREPVDVLILRFSGLVLLLIGCKLMYGHDLDTFIVVRSIGAAIVVGGLVLSLWALNVLGTGWMSTSFKRQRLIIIGPFRRMRHPVYAGRLLSGIGLGLVSLNIFYALAALLITGVSLSRISAEETYLEKEHRMAYARYKHKTGRLFTRIRKARGPARQ